MNETQILEWCQSRSIHVLATPRVSCPLLAEISQPPQVLYVLGDPSLLTGPCLSIVGTRRPSVYGLKASLEFSKKLAALGITIVSGLARGIDGAAHRGALLAGGKTVAVLGHGLAYRYPLEHTALADEIVAKGGCLVSEFPPFIPPRSQHFPQRNRLISGFSLGTLVIEAAEKSGSLITARLAMEQNREVYVLPSHYDEKSFGGSHRLLQEGAKLVVNIGDILEEIKNLLPLNPSPTVAKDGSCSRLRGIFKAEEVGLSLSQIVGAVGRTSPGILEELLTAVGLGLVVECAPQIYVWVGD